MGNIKIGGRLESVATGNIVAGADAILDDDKHKTQSEINSITDTRISTVEEDLGTKPSGSKSAHERITDVWTELNAKQYSAESIETDETATQDSTKLLRSGKVYNELLNNGYFECSTAANTAAKVVSATGYVLRAGGSIKIKMTYANTAANATLNINSTGAKPLFYNNERASSINSWEEGETIVVYYDGTTNFYATNVLGGGIGSGVYDISEKNKVNNEPSTYSDFSYILNASRVNTLIPIKVRAGGMSVKFIKFTPATYTVTKTVGLDTQPTGTELVSSSSVGNGTYTADSLSDFSTLPTAINGTVTYYYTITTTTTEEVEGEQQEVTTTTYTRWIVKKITADIYDYEQWRYVTKYTNDTTGNNDFKNIANWQGIDKELVPESINLVTSGAAYAAVNAVDEKATIETNVPDVKDTITWEVGTLNKTTGGNTASTSDVRIQGIVSFDDYVFVTFGDYRSQYTIRICYFNNNDVFVYYQDLEHCDFVIPPNTKFRFVIWGGGTVTDLNNYTALKRLTMRLGGYSQYQNYFKGVTFNGMAYAGTGATSTTLSNSMSIPLPSGVTSLKIKGTVSNLANLVGFYAADYSKISYGVWKNNEADSEGCRTFTVPANTVYYSVQFGINRNADMYVKDASTNEIIWKPLDNIRATIPVNEAIRELRQGEDTTPKGFSYDNFVDYMNQINYASLVFLHFSDIHNNKANLLRILNFAKKYESKIDDILNTGDTVGSKWDSGITFFTDCEGHEKILNVIGNHDSSSTGSGEWSYYTAAQCYGRYIEPFVTNWGVTMGGENVCYYYKDYSSIRLIVLDRMHWDSTQETWFTNLLQNSLSKKVIIASHGTPATIAPSDKSCNMDTYYADTISPNSGMNSDSIMVEAVDDFIDAGGTFICWLGGHTHWDAFRYITGHPRQLCILVGTASADAVGNSLFREKGTQSEDNFNIFSVHTGTSTLAIRKIGCNTNRMGLSMSCLVYDYSEHQIIMQY